MVVGLAAAMSVASAVTSRGADDAPAPPPAPSQPHPMDPMPEMMERSFLMPALPAAAEYVPGVEEKYPRLRYADGQISLNDRCPVRHVKLNPKMPPVYLNGKPIGFC